jgi:hypothetical protein
MTCRLYKVENTFIIRYYFLDSSFKEYHKFRFMNRNLLYFLFGIHFQKIPQVSIHESKTVGILVFDITFRVVVSKNTTSFDS